jgi:hypothetical protein
VHACRSKATCHSQTWFILIVRYRANLANDNGVSPANAFLRTTRAPADGYKVIAAAGNYLGGEAVEAFCLPKLQYIFTTRSYFYLDPIQNL